MCKGKHHKSKKHSSVFFNGSLNHSEDEKADTSLFGWVQNGGYLASDSSDFWLIYQAVGSAARLWAREIFCHSHPLYNVCLFSEALCLVTCTVGLNGTPHSSVLTSAFGSGFVTSLVQQFAPNSVCCWEFAQPAVHYASNSRNALSPIIPLYQAEEEINVNVTQLPISSVMYLAMSAITHLYHI